MQVYLYILAGLYFDGKDDLTLTNEGKDKDLATIKEHHISITLHNSTKPAGSGENGMYAGFVKSGGKGLFITQIAWMFILCSCIYARSLLI